MRRISLVVQATGLTLSWAAISLLIQSCSPLSGSQNKLRLHSAPVPVSNGGTSSASKDRFFKFNPADSATALTHVPATIRSLETYVTETSVLPQDQKVTISKDSSPETLDAFKSSRTLTLHFGGHAPDRCKAFVGVVLSDAEVDNFGWNNPDSPVTIDCAVQPDGNWKVSVSETIPADVWTQLASNIESVTIFAASNPKMSVVKAEAQPPIRLRIPKGNVHSQ